MDKNSLIANMKKIFLLLFLLPITGVTLFSQKDTIWPFIKTRSLGNYIISSKKSSQKINIKVERVYFKKDIQHGWNESDVSIIISDSKGSVLHKKNYPGDQDGQLDISADSISFRGIGKMLLIHYSSLPSCGGCGEDVQIFGLNSLGYLVPYTGVIRVYGDILPNSFFNLKWAESSDDLITEGSHSDFNNCKNCKPYIECIRPTGYGDLISFGYYPLEPEGTLEDGFSHDVKLNKIPLQVGDSNYFTIDQITDEDGNDMIQLYSEPDNSSKTQTFQLKKGMIVKFFEGLDYKWIHLRLSGYEGYLEWNEIWKLGFPAHE
jgi:hypothetical protein